MELPLLLPQSLLLRIRLSLSLYHASQTHNILAPIVDRSEGRQALPSKPSMALTVGRWSSYDEATHFLLRQTAIKSKGGEQ